LGLGLSRLSGEFDTSRTNHDQVREPAQPRGILHYVLLLVLVGSAYFAAARFGLALAFATRQVSAIWPPTGIALTALLVLGYRIWPGIYLGALLVNAMANEPLSVAVIIATGNTVTGVLGARLLRTLRFDGALKRSRDVVSLFAVAVGSTVISATSGATTLTVSKIVPWAEYTSVWCVWWTGDTLGILIAAPVLLTCIQQPRIHWKGVQLAEFSSYLAAAVLIGLFVFVLPSGDGTVYYYPRAYVTFPLLAWAGLRLGSREAALGVAIISGFAVWGGIHGHGPFGLGALDSRLVLLDTFVATVGCTGLLIAAVTAERQYARMAARESESLLRTIVEHTPAVVYVKDLQGRYLMVNRRYEELWGSPHRPLLGKSDYDVFSREEADLFRAMDQRVIRLGHALTEEEVAARHDGQHVYVSVKCPLRNDTGETCGIVGISTDVTELHQAQARLREAYEELEKRVLARTAELAAVVEELGQRNQEKEILLREIHHRVKNNLQVVCSLLNLQAYGHENPGLINFVQDCRARVRSMALVHEHLYQSKDLHSVPLAAYLDALVQEVAQTQPASGTVRCSVDANAITLPVDQAIPCGLIVNELVTNALKHAFPGNRPGEVSVSILEDAAQRVRLSVHDDGVGIPENVDLAGGAGFGLSLVSMLAEQLQATVDFERQRGTRIQLSFARCRAQ
jgi:PAS domain S-box-containing protein